MTTERQIIANRRNALASTGPRTAAGKATSSQNSTRHGLYAAAPIIPRLESSDAWEQHRAATLRDLAPANAVEHALAQRVALILWRLGRVTRYEQAATTSAQHQVPDEIAESDDPADAARIRAQFASARRYFRAFTRFQQLRADAPMSGPEADAVVVGVCWQVKDTGFDLATFEVPGLIAADDHIPDVPGWTVARVQQFVDAIAEATQRDPHDLLQAAHAMSRNWHSRARADYARLSRRLHNLRRERILPLSASMDSVIRYETHLTRQLDLALAQLRRLQRHREADRLRPPYHDYHVDLDTVPYSPDETNPIPGETPSSQPGPVDVYSTSQYTSSTP